MVNTIFRFLTIILVALLAGVSFGIWKGANPMQLTPLSYLEQQQNTIGSLQALMISLVVGATLVTLITAFLHRQDKLIFISLIIAALFLISCMLITKFGNVPIDSLVMSWTVDTMPADWMTYRNKWWNYHIARTAVEMVALVIVTWVLVRNNGKLVSQ